MSTISEPLISAIIPTYNRVERLKIRVKELQEQTMDNWEAIIVDDHSDDGTKEYIETITDTRFKSVSLDRNSGSVTIPRNIGIVNCHGKYICHTDDDVEMDPDKFRILSTALDKYNSAILAYGDRYNKYEFIGRKTKVSDPDWNPFSGPAVDNGQIMYRNCYDRIPLVFCTRACDWELAKILRNLGPFMYINRVVSTYIWHSSNRSLDPNTKTRPLDIEYFKKYIPAHFKLLTV